VGVRVTPAFFVNGRPLHANSFEAFDKLVAEELARASSSGVAAADYYGRVVIANGLTAVKGRFRRLSKQAELARTKRGGSAGAGALAPELNDRW